MPAPYQPLAIANQFLTIANNANISDVSPMKLQKLIYYAHAWYLALNSRPLINDRVQAWTFGPVVSDIYQSFKQWGNNPITAPATQVEFEDGKLVSRTPYVDDDDQYIHDFLAEVWRVYGALGPIQLSNMTHEAPSPSHDVASQYDFKLPTNIDIRDELIEQRFREKLETGEA